MVSVSDHAQICRRWWSEWMGPSPCSGAEKEKKMEFKLRRAMPVAMAIGVTATLTAPTPWRATAEAAEVGCSNATLRGDYGFDINGTILAGPKAGPLRGVAMTHFDGQGSLNQVDFVTNNGVPGGTEWRPATGTYEIDEDCKGTAEIVFSDGSPNLQLRLVVVDRGREIFTITESNPTGSTGIRVR
jgi:hypothetical protein